MVIVPVRVLPALVATEKLVEPLPVPLAPELIVIQPSLLMAVHTQPEGAVTLTAPGPPESAKDWLEGLIEKEQAAPASSSVAMSLPPA
jgi:hypothetical protein